MALSIADIKIELREILLNDRPQNLYEISSKGTVPVLQVTDKVFDESLDIMFWAIGQSKECENYLKNITSQKELINQNDVQFKKWLDRYKYNDRFDEYNLEKCKSNCKKIINQYESNLNNHIFLTNNYLKIVDIAIFPFIRQFANVDIKYFSNSFPKTNDWLNRIKDSELFKSVMKKYPQWNFRDKPKIINFKSELVES